MTSIETSLNSLFENGFWAAFATSAAIALAALLALRLLNRMLRGLAERGRLDRTAEAYFRRILDAVVIVLAALGVFSQVKPLRGIAASLLASSGVAAVILGFAGQQAMSNIVGGFFLSVFKPFAIGDRIKLRGQDVEGFVEDVSLRHSVVRTFENNRVIVPNSVMNSAVIENAHYGEGKVCRFLDVGVCVEADLSRAMGIFADTARAHPALLDNRTEDERNAGAPEVSVRLTEIRDGVANLRASLWAKDAGAAYGLACDVLLEVKKRFDEAGVKLPRRVGPP